MARMFLDVEIDESKILLKIKRIKELLDEAEKEMRSLHFVEVTAQKEEPISGN